MIQFTYFVLMNCCIGRLWAAYPFNNLGKIELFLLMIKYYNIKTLTKG